MSPYPIKPTAAKDLYLEEHFMHSRIIRTVVSASARLQTNCEKVDISIISTWVRWTGTLDLALRTVIRSENNYITFYLHVYKDIGKSITVASKQIDKNYSNNSTK